MEKEMNSVSKKIKARIIVSGSVQGVGYRFRTARQARKLGIRGFVRNLDNNDVEIFCEADSKEQLDEFIRQISLNEFLIVVEEVKVFFPSDKNYIDYKLKEDLFYIEY
ncbi:MAG: acylphosphatase [Candidatus Micrarchaeia archaeon]